MYNPLDDLTKEELENEELVKCMKATVAYKLYEIQSTWAELFESTPIIKWLRKMEKKTC